MLLCFKLSFFLKLCQEEAFFSGLNLRFEQLLGFMALYEWIPTMTRRKENKHKELNWAGKWKKCGSYCEQCCRNLGREKHPHSLRAESTVSLPAWGGVWKNVFAFVIGFTCFLWPLSVCSAVIAATCFYWNDNSKWLTHATIVPKKEKLYEGCIYR